MTVSAEDAALIKGMLARGDDQHQIAYYLGENQGRVNETAKGHRWPDVEPCSPELLPPPFQLKPGRELIATMNRHLEHLQIMLDEVKDAWRQPPKRK